MNKIKKILILSHVEYQNTYGAATSLRNHVEILKKSKYGKHISVISNKYPKFFLQSMLRTNSFSGKNELPMPLNKVTDYCEGGSHIPSLRSIIKWTLYAPLYAYSFIYIVRKISSNNVDILHLNSPVLIGLGFTLKMIVLIFGKKLSIVVHMRDFLRHDASFLQKYMFRYIDRFICIDESVKSNMLKVINVKENDVYVITNPFSSLGANAEIKIIDFDFQLDVEYFAIVGNIHKDKGVEFVIDSFLACSFSKKKLLVVGNGEGDYFNMITEKINQSDSIHYLGEINSLANTNFYRDIDCIVRGDLSFRTGRTVYEALYNNCVVFLPKDPNSNEKDTELDKFSSHTYYYKPRDAGLLKDLFCKYKGKINKNYTSNFSIYRDKILTTYDGI